MHPTKIAANDERDLTAYYITHHAHTIDTTTMLNKVTPVVHPVVELLFQACCQKLYKGGRWTEMPLAPIKLEKDMYGPFVEICQFIHNAIHNPSFHPVDDEINPEGKSLLELQHGQGWRNIEVVGGQWNALPNDSPKSRDDTSADIRPDVDFSTASKERLELAQLVNSLAQELASLQESVSEWNQRADTIAALETKLNETHAQLDSKMQRWWRQLHTVGEFKRALTPSEVAESAVQTIGGLRYILREQMDRRFAFGITLCQDKLSLWLCDRSGLLGSKTSIDIHKDPKSFIRVIAAFSILRPEQIGWDTTMKLYLPVSGTCVSSYLHHFDISNYNNSVYDIHWAISMPAEGKSEQDARETFITVRCLKAIGLEDTCGRGTLVWEAVKHSELPNPEKVYVLKQSWRPSAQGVETAAQEMATEDVTSEARSEAEMYDLIHRALMDCDREPLKSDAEYVAQMYSYEDVCIGGIVDTTLGLIRQDLTMDPYVPTQRNRKRLQERDESFESLAHMVMITEDTIMIVAAEEATFPLGRTHTRIVLKTFGWAIKYFLDLEELLRMFIDATKGHRFLYLCPGIVHRDVSSGNILICPSSIYDASTTTGRIIDLDHAKATSGFVELYGDRVAVPSTVSQALAHRPVDPQFIELLWSRLCTVFRSHPGPVVYDDDDIFGCMYIYVSKLLHHSRPDHKLTCEELGWEIERPLQRPSFDGHTPSRGPRSGTAPFMSGEVLSQRRISHLPGTKKIRNAVHVHDAIHDMESLFWVLVYLCLTRSGPGGHRRTEMSPCDAPDDDRKRLWHGVFCLFDGDLATLSANKVLLLGEETVFSDYVLPLVHPYFEDLKELLQEWWDLLLIAYEFRLMEYDMIHDRVIALLERTLIAVREKAKGMKGEHPFTIEERQRREDDLRRIREAFAAFAGPRPSTPVRSAPPPTAGISPSTILAAAARDYSGTTIDEPVTSHSSSSPTQSSKKPKV